MDAGFLDPEAGVNNEDEEEVGVAPSSFFGNGIDVNNPLGGLFSKPAQAPKFAVVKSSVDELVDGETGSSSHVSSRLFGDGGESTAAAAAAVLASIEAASVVAPVEVDQTSTFFGGSGVVTHEIERLGLPLRVLPDASADASRQVTLVSTSDLFADETVVDEDDDIYINDKKNGNVYFGQSGSKEDFTYHPSQKSEEIFEPERGDIEGRGSAMLSSVSGYADHSEYTYEPVRSQRQTSKKDSRRLPTPGGAMDFFKTLPRSSGNKDSGWDVFSSLPSDAISEEELKKEEESTYGMQQAQEDYYVNGLQNPVKDKFEDYGELLDPAPSSASNPISSSVYSTSLPLPPWETNNSSFLSSSSSSSSISSSNLPPWETPHSNLNNTTNLSELSIAPQPPSFSTSVPPWEIGVTAPKTSSASTSASATTTTTTTTTLATKQDSVSRTTRAPWEEPSLIFETSSSTDVSNTGFIPSASVKKPTNSQTKPIGSQKAFVPSASAFEFSASVPSLPPLQPSSSSSSSSSTPINPLQSATASPEVEGHLSSGVPPRTAMQHPGLKKKSTIAEGFKAKPTSRYFNPSIASDAASSPISESALTNENDKVTASSSKTMVHDIVAPASLSSSTPFTTYSNEKRSKLDSDSQLKLARTSGASFGFGGRLVLFGRNHASTSSSSSSSTHQLHIFRLGSILESSKAPFHSAIMAFPGPLSSANMKKLHGERSNISHASGLKDSVLQFLTMLDSPAVSNNEGDEEPGILGGFKGFRNRDLSLLHTVLRLIVEHNGSLYQSSCGHQSLLPGVAKAIASALMGGLESVDIAMKSEKDGWVCRSELEALTKTHIDDNKDNSIAKDTPNDKDLQIAQQEVDKALCSGDRIEAFEAALLSKLWTQAVLLGMGLGGAALGRVASAFSDSLPSQSVSRWVFPALSGDLSMIVRQPLLNSTLKTAMTAVSSPAGASATTAATSNAINEVQQRLSFCNAWRSRLALLLLNGVTAATEPRTLISLGDRVWAETGSSACAHALYIIAGATIEPPSPHARVVLVGADHRRRLSTFLSDVRSIQRSEVLEYALLLRGGANCDELRRASPVMQPLKLVYAMALADSDQTLASKASAYLQSIDANLKEVDEEKRFNPMFLAEFSAFNTRLQVHLGKISPPPPDETISSREIQEAEAAMKAAKVAPSSVVSGAAIGSKPITESSSSGTVKTSQPLIDAVKSERSDTSKSQTSSQNNSTSSSGGGGILSSLTGIIFRRAENAISSTSASAAGPKIVKHAHLAKTNAPQPYFDDKLKRWIFPGEETTAASSQVAPPTSNSSNANIAGSSTSSSVAATSASSDKSTHDKSKSETNLTTQPSTSQAIESQEKTNLTGTGTGGGGAARRSGRSRYVDTLGGGTAAVPAAQNISNEIPVAVNPFINNRPSSSSSKYSVFAPPPPPAPTQQELEEAEAERQRVLQSELDALRKTQSSSSVGIPQANDSAEGVNNQILPSKTSEDSLESAVSKPQPALPDIDF